MLGKRRLSEEFPLHEDDPDLHILVSGRDAPLAAHYDVLKLYSKCVKGLPRSSDGGPTVWDVTQLLPEGGAQPFGPAAVEHYLDLVYSHIDRRRKMAPPSSLRDAKPLLLFADAVGSSPVVFEDLARVLVGAPDLRLEVDVDAQLRLSLALRGHLYTIADTLHDDPIPSDGTSTVITPVGELDDGKRQCIRTAVCAALEEWLYLAGRLRMVPLVRLLLDFVKTQLVGEDVSLLLDSIRDVYSQRVLQCMPPALLFEGFLRDSLTNLPSAVSMEATSVKVTVDSAAVSPFFGCAAGTAVQMHTETIDGDLHLADDTGGCLRVSMGLGGFGAKRNAELVREILSKAGVEE